MNSRLNNIELKQKLLKNELNSIELNKILLIKKQLNNVLNEQQKQRCVHVDTDDEDECVSNNNNTYNESTTTQTSTNNSNTPVKLIDNANKTSEWYWSMHRLYLGTEWSRIKMKLNMYKTNYKKYSQLLSKYEKLNKTEEQNEIVDDDDDEQHLVETTEADDESTARSTRCLKVDSINLFKRRLIKFDSVLKPYLNWLNYLNENQYEKQMCKCKFQQMCILCYLNKIQLMQKYNKYSSDLVQSIYSEHSYSKTYTPTFESLPTINNNKTHFIDNQNSNDFIKDCNISFNYQLTHTPPPTPQQSSTTNCTDLITDETDSSSTTTSSTITTTTTTTIDMNNKNYLKSSNLNKYNLYMSSNTYYMNLFETSYKNYYNNIILDAGNELDPNDVHKLPNIYDELRFYNSQNDENLLNGIINKRKRYKRKWSNIHNNYELTSDLTETALLHGNEKYFNGDVITSSTTTRHTDIHHHKRRKYTTSSSNTHKRRIKRRSASSCSSTNSSLSSSYTAGSSSTFGFNSYQLSNSNYMILNDSHNKFDIDNIVIPYDILYGSSHSGADSTKLLQKQEIETPTWRIIDYNNTSSIDTDHNMSEHINTNDEFYRKLHEFNELKERYYSVFKKLEKDKLKQQQRQQTGDDQQTFGNLCIEEFKTLVNKLENEHNKRKLNNHHISPKPIFSPNSSHSSQNSLFSIKSELNQPWTPRLFPLNEYDEAQLFEQQNNNVKMERQHQY